MNQNIMGTSFQCKHCGQEYKCEGELFSIAVFLYGIFFLTDGKYGYTGITCPRCLKTITNEGEISQTALHWKSASFFLAFGRSSDIILKYHSSYNSFQDINKVKINSSSVHYHSGELSDKDLAAFRNGIDLFKQKFNLYENHFCTYAFDDDLPMGSSFSVGWFTKEQIDYFIKIENDKSLRIFPRYILYNSIYDDIERFCWEYYSKEIVNRITARSKSKKSLIPTDFLSILVDDPLPLVFFPFPFGDGAAHLHDMQFKSFWKIIHPFFNKEFKKDLFDCDLAEFEEPQKKPDHDEKATFVKENFHKGFIQDLLYEHHLDFIKEYIKLSRKIDFSYAAIWQLKEGYLDRLYNALIEKQLSGFYQRHRIECRKVADKIWKDEIKNNKPITTIEKMMQKDEVNEVFKGETYHDSTMRKWLKDLCPNRKPGPRPIIKK